MAGGRLSTVPVETPTGRRSESDEAVRDVFNGERDLSKIDQTSA